jgi:hypothetical protein
MSTKSIAWITGSLTLLLALFSFILSFNALADLAAKHSVSIPPLFPLVVEAGVVIFSLNALYRSLHGESAKWQWSLIIGSSLLAGLFNVLHAETDLVSRAIAAMPSLFLLLSFETFLGQIKHVVKRSNLVKSVAELTEELNTTCAELDNLIATKQAELETLTKQVNQLNVTIEQSQATLDQLRQEIEQAKRVQASSFERAKDIKAKRDAVVIEQRRSQLLSILTVEGDIGASAFADRLHASRGTVYSDLKALSEAGQIIKNGTGWEVAG